MNLFVLRGARVLAGVAAATLLAGCTLTFSAVLLPDTVVPEGGGVPPMTQVAGHTIPLPPNDGLVDRFDLFDSAGGGANSTFSDYVRGSLSYGAPPWTEADLDAQITEVQRLGDHLGVPVPRPDPLKGIVARGVPATWRAEPLACEDTGTDCSLLVLDVDIDFGQARWVALPDPERPIREVRRFEPLDSGAFGLVLDGAGPDTDRAVEVDLAEAVRMSRAAFSFVHLADVQIREATVKFQGRGFSSLADRLVHTFERNPDQERYEVFVYDALVRTIGADVRQARSLGAFAAHPPPTFLLHTGDAIDAGLEREFVRFHQVTDTLEIPWFDAAGNHDVLAFGNLAAGRETPIGELVPLGGGSSVPGTSRSIVKVRLMDQVDCVEGTVDCPGFLSAAESPLGRFIEAHGRHTGVPVDLPGAATANHGFDLNDNLGYYRFDLPVDLEDGVDRRSIFLVLETNTLTGGAGSWIDEAQHAWLSGQLELRGDGTPIRPGDVVFVAGHHPLPELRVPEGLASVSALLEGSPNVVAFLAGHTHAHDIRPHPAAGQNRGFWEIETGAILTWPQEARLITMRTLPGGLAFLESLTFSQATQLDGSPYAEGVSLGAAGALEDACREPGLECDKGSKEPITRRERTDTRLFFRLPGS